MIRHLAPLFLFASAPALAADLRDVCPDRPGRGTPPCIVDAGHMQVETGLIDWSRDRRGGIASDQIAWGATEVRVGLTRHLEVEVNWSPFNTSTITDRATGIRQHVQGTGDATFSLRQSLANPDGKGFSLAVQPFVTAPIGHSGIGGNGWAAGVLLPLAADIGGGFGVGATPQVAWSVNANDGGHHASYGGVVSLGHPIGGVQVGAELYLVRDDDPAGHTTAASADVTLAWVPPHAKNLQFDAGVNAGLNHDTPQLEFYIGVARRF